MQSTMLSNLIINNKTSVMLGTYIKSISCI